MANLVYINELITDMKSTEGLAALFHYATEGIIVTNDSGEITKTNPAALKMFGYDEHELEGNKIEVLIPSRFSKKHSETRKHYAYNPHARAMGLGLDLLAKRKDGSEFPVEISLSPYESENQKFFIAFIIDITHRKQIEDKLRFHSLNLEKQVEKRTMILQEAIDELEKTKEELRQALEKERELGELKSRFVAMASHEFRTPLATILSSLSLVDKYGSVGEKEKQQKHITRIKASINSLTDILNDVLSISKLEEGKISVSAEELHPEVFIKALINDLQSLLKEGQIVKYNHSGNHKIMMDKKILQHILFNLVSNAIKFSEENTIIDITTTLLDNNLKLVIKDQGIGISEEDQKHLFERFFRANNATNIQGTGLGLNIVSKYVELLNGQIELKSVINQGTTCIVTLPNLIL